jgi:hypothetical protein
VTDDAHIRAALRELAAVTDAEHDDHRKVILASAHAELRPPDHAAASSAVVRSMNLP